MTTDTKEKYVIGRLKTLGFEVAQLTHSVEWQRWLEVKSRFPSYSMYNTMLIYAQFPTAVEVQGYVAWQRIGRQVQAGKGTSIKIMAPIRGTNAEEEEEIKGFRFVSVFDYQQTKPESLITKFDRKTGQTVTIFSGTPYERIEWPMMDDDETAAYLPHLVGAIDNTEGAPEVIFTNVDMGGARGRYWPTKHIIEIRKDLPQAQQVGTLLHELGHAYDAGLMDDDDRARREHVAESVAWMAAAGLGIDKTDTSAYYLSSWHAGETELLSVVRRVTNSYRGVSKILDSTAVAIAAEREELGA